MASVRIPVRAWAALTETVTREKTVAHFHDDMPEVYGTPFMIYLMELAAASAIRPYLPPGWISVGAGIDVKHLAATPTGFTITARAEVLEWDGKVVTFGVEAKDGVELIGQGRHVRAPVELARFNRGVAAKTLKRPERDQAKGE